MELQYGRNVSVKASGMISQLQNVHTVLLMLNHGEYLFLAHAFCCSRALCRSRSSSNVVRRELVEYGSTRNNVGISLALLGLVSLWFIDSRVGHIRKTKWLINSRYFCRETLTLWSACVDWRDSGPERGERSMRETRWQDRAQSIGYTAGKRLIRLHVCLAV